MLFSKIFMLEAFKFKLNIDEANKQQFFFCFTRLLNINQIIHIHLGIYYYLLFSMKNSRNKICWLFNVFLFIFLNFIIIIQYQKIEHFFELINFVFVVVVAKETVGSKGISKSFCFQHSRSQTIKIFQL